MADLEQIFASPAFSRDPITGAAWLCEELHRLTLWHAERCLPYRRLLDAVYSSWQKPPPSLADVPYVAGRLFKNLQLQSVPDSEIARVLVSSGTTGQRPSRIVLDRETAMLQTRALAHIMQSFLGPRRLPMLIVDTASILRDPAALTARGAGLLGFSSFGRDHCYALDDNLQPATNRIREFLQRHAGEPVLIFGFTFMIWQHLCGELGPLLQPDLSQSVLVHGGGWKKMREMAVDNATFKKTLRDRFGLRRVHNFYGMVEQVGSVFVECEEGYLHAPAFADLVVRDPATWQETMPGRAGVLEVLSCLPRSYPGHALLTEDTGVLAGRDGCACGRRGTYFLVEGRIPQAELRGCSDVYAASTTEGGRK